MTLRWIGKVVCEGGGPVMVADLPGFAQWTGGVPFTELRAADPGHAQALAQRMNTLHYWGQFTDRLPAPFRADGGHQYITCASETAAEAKLAELRAAVRAAFPTATVHADETRTHFFLPETEEEMTAEVSPQSEYDAAWQTKGDTGSFHHSFGDDAGGFFWDIEGSGVVDVGVSDDGTELVMVRSWMSEEDEDDVEQVAAVRAFVTSRRADEEPVGDVEISSGKAVCIWSPIAPFQLEGMDAGPEALMMLGEQAHPVSLSTRLIGDVGTILRLRPGRYMATLGDTDGNDDDDDANGPPWSCRWCRLTLRAEN